MIDAAAELRLVGREIAKTGGASSGYCGPGGEIMRRVYRDSLAAPGVRKIAATRAAETAPASLSSKPSSAGTVTHEGAPHPQGRKADRPRLSSGAMIKLLPGPHATGAART